MKQANHVFEKVTKYAIRKLSVGVGPVAIGTFLLAGGLFVSKPVSADQVTSDASVHMAYVTAIIAFCVFFSTAVCASRSWSA